MSRFFTCLPSTAQVQQTNEGLGGDGRIQDVPGGMCQTSGECSLS